MFLAKQSLTHLPPPPDLLVGPFSEVCDSTTGLHLLGPCEASRQASQVLLT